jgi:hypothetical protein
VACWAIVSEWDRGGHLIGASVDPNPDIELSERCHELIVEVGDRLGCERQSLHAAGIRPDRQHVIDKSKSIWNARPSKGSGRWSGHVV